MDPGRCLQKACKFSFYYCRAAAGMPQSDGRSCTLVTADLLVRPLFWFYLWTEWEVLFYREPPKQGADGQVTQNIFSPGNLGWRRLAWPLQPASWDNILCHHQPSASSHQQAGLQRVLAHLLYLTCLCPCFFIVSILPGKVHKILLLAGAFCLLQVFRLYSLRVVHS